MLRLKELRKDCKVTQLQIAEYLGVSRPTYTRYENGEREPNIETIIKIAKYFNISIDYLFGIESPINVDTSNPLSIGLQLEGMDVEIYKCAKDLSDVDKSNVLRYIDFIKKRNEV